MRRCGCVVSPRTDTNPLTQVGSMGLADASLDGTRPKPRPLRGSFGFEDLCCPACRRQRRFMT